MTTGYYCAIFPFCGGGKKKDKKTKAFYDWATTGIPVITGNTTRRLFSKQLLYIDPVLQTYFSNHEAISASLIESHVVSQQVLYGQNGFTLKKHSGLGTNIVRQTVLSSYTISKLKPTWVKDSYFRLQS